MKKIYKVLGKRGRITIPWEIRMEQGFAYNDVVSFETEGDTVRVKREKICDGCKNSPVPQAATTEGGRVMSLAELRNSLTRDELRTILISLSLRWAELTQGGDEHA